MEEATDLDEQRRLSALESYDVLDSDPEPPFDRIVRTAARIFDTPMASVSLVDANRQWFKSCVGIDATETSRDVSFCTHALASDDLLVIPDATADPRFSSNPLVTGEPFVRFYAGAPLITPSAERLGTLCIIDTKPRPLLDDEARRTLVELAALVMDLLESRKAGIERKVALTEADENNRLLVAAVASSIDAILTKDPTGIITSWNPAAEKLYGYSAAEMIGNSVIRLIPQDLKGEEGEILARILRGESIEHYETRRVTKTGEVVDIALSVSPVRASDGSVIGAASIARDIRESKAIQRERDAAAEALREGREMAERANHAKSDFLSRMSHDLRTPLNAILGFGQLLELDDLTEDQAQNVAEMIRGGRHLLELINEILDISRIETGRLALSIEPVALAQVVEAATSLISPLAAQRGIDLTVQPVDAELHVRADQQRLKQILINLLSNAIKYNRIGGSVNVSWLRSSEGRVIVSVADTGPGIRPGQVEAIFTPFERLDAEASYVEGTGLGLAISRRLAEAMEGHLGVSSVVGRGSTFSLELSADSHEAFIEGGAELAPPELKTASTILYVEDNVSNLRLVERIVARTKDVRLIPCGLGADAAPLAASERPDLILLDLNLPDMSGRDVLDRLRIDPLTAGIPVVVLSADATQTRMNKLLQSGARAYLTKPIDVGAFTRIIEEVLAEGTEPRLLAEEAR